MRVLVIPEKARHARNTPLQIHKELAPEGTPFE
jgi:hypothetical protein